MFSALIFDLGRLLVFSLSLSRCVARWMPTQRHLHLNHLAHGSVDDFKGSANENFSGLLSLRRNEREQRDAIYTSDTYRRASHVYSTRFA